MMEPIGDQMSCRRVEVVYYLSRGGHLEHPHLIQLSLSTPSQGLYLRDVKERMNAIRGKGMPTSFSWSYKRIYKNGYVWQDLCDDDLIFPVNGCEYVLKGSEILVATDPFHNTVGENGDNKLQKWSLSGHYRKSRHGGISTSLNLDNSCLDATPPPMTPPSSSPFLLRGSIVSPPPSSSSLIGEGPLALSSSSSGETVMAFQDDQFNVDNEDPLIRMQVSSNANAATAAAAAYGSDWGNNGVDVAIQTEVEEESSLNKSSSPVKNKRSNIGTSTSDQDFFDGCPPPVLPCPLSAPSPSTASMVCSSDHEYPSFGHYTGNEHRHRSCYHTQDYLHHTHELSSSPLPSEGSFRKAMVKMNFAKKAGSPSSSASSFVSSISTIGASKNSGVSSSTKLHFAPCGRSGLDVREEVFLMRKRSGSNNKSNNNSMQKANLSDKNPMGPHNHPQDAVSIKCHSSLSERSLGDTDLGTLQDSRRRDDDALNREGKSITSSGIDRTRRSSVASTTTNYTSSSSCHQQEQQTRQKSVSYYESVGLFLEEFLMRRSRSTNCKLDRRLSSSRCSSVRKEAWKLFTLNN